MKHIAVALALVLSMSSASLAATTSGWHRNKYGHPYKNVFYPGGKLISYTIGRNGELRSDTGHWWYTKTQRCVAFDHWLQGRSVCIPWPR